MGGTRQAPLCRSGHPVLRVTVPHRPTSLALRPSCGHAPTPNPGECQVHDHQPRTGPNRPGCKVWGNGGESTHAKRQSRTIFFKAPCQYSELALAKKNLQPPKKPFVFSMKPRVCKPQKGRRQLGFNWRLVFSSLFSEVKSHKTQVPFSVPA